MKLLGSHVLHPGESKLNSQFVGASPPSQTRLGIAETSTVQTDADGAGPVRE
jgi:hypothetical protein